VEVNGKKAMVVGVRPAWPARPAERLRDKGADVAILPDLPRSPGDQGCRGDRANFHPVT